MVSSGKFYFFVCFILFFSQKGLAIGSQGASSGGCEGKWFFGNTGIDLIREVSDVENIDELSPEARIHLILPIERLNLKHSTERIAGEKAKHIGGLTEMTKEEAGEAFGSLEAVEIRDALLSKGLDFGMPFKWPFSPGKIREIQLEAREVALAKLRPDQRVNLFRYLAELNLSESSRNILRSSGMYHIGKLVAQTEKDILRMSNDRDFLKEIKDALSEWDLTLGKIYDWPNRPDQVQRLKERFKVSLNSSDIVLLQ